MSQTTLESALRILRAHQRWTATQAATAAAIAANLAAQSRISEV